MVMSFSHRWVSCVTLVLCIYNGVKKSCHWCLPSSILPIWDIFRTTDAIYNIQETGIPYRFTAEKSQATPYSLLCSRLDHAISVNIKNASQNVCHHLATDGCISGAQWVTFLYEGTPAAEGTSCWPSCLNRQQDENQRSCGFWIHLHAPRAPNFFRKAKQDSSTKKQRVMN